MKLIVFTSAGTNWVGKFLPPAGNIQGRKIIHFLLDIEEIMSKDPVNELPIISGLDSKITQWIIGQPNMSNWLAEKKKWMLNEIQKYSHDDQVILCFNGRCKGGFQRSPAVVQYLADWLKTKLNSEYKIIISHLTINLASQVKKAISS